MNAARGSDHTRIFIIAAWTLAIAGSITLVGALIAYFARMRDVPGVRDPSDKVALELSNVSADWGTFGDFIGGFAGTLISLTTLVILAIAVHLQSSELKIAQKTLRAASTENTLFHLLEQLKEIIRNVRGRTDFTGHKALETTLKRITHAIQHIESEARFSFGNRDEWQKAIETEVRKHIHTYPDLDHYFGTLFHVFKFIRHNKNLDGDDDTKILYANLVRSLLTPNEILLLFYNCLSTPGYTEFKPLIEDFGLLKHLDSSRLANKDHLQFYRPQAFQGSEARKAMGVVLR